MLEVTLAYYFFELISEGIYLDFCT